MPMLAGLMQLGCSLVDYETIVDEHGRRLIFFGLHAGYAGMIEGLWCLDRRLRSRGRPSPLESVRHAYQYDDLGQARAELEPIAERLRQRGAEAGPLIFGIAGYGNVARGCQEVLGWLGAVEVDVSELPDLASGRSPAPAPLLTVVFREEDMVEPVADAETRNAGTSDAETGAVPAFELQDYYDHPERYRGRFESYLPHLDMLVNAAYWDERYPRLVTRRWAQQSYGGDDEPRLQVIADISCDLEGGIELTLKSTQPDAPCFTYDPRRDAVEMGYAGAGPVVMAVDNLPCELPRESSEHFSRVLRDMVPALAAADWRADFERLDLPLHLKRAVIVHRGELTPAYHHLKDHLETTS
jgi:alpha-aminoadipic semialdehyde synthase